MNNNSENTTSDVAEAQKPTDKKPDVLKAVETPPKELTVAEQIKLIDAKTTAKEAASKSIGKSAVPWIVVLVAIGVLSSYFLPASAITAVIGLVATATMALIAMLSGITGTRAEPDKPEFVIIQDLIDRLDRHEPLTVEIQNENVIVTHGSNRVVTKRLSGETEKPVDKVD